MTDINLKTLTPDTSLPTTGFLFGADSQASTNPSVYSTQTVATTLLGSTSLTGDTLTADAPVLNLSQTWNNGAVTFTGIKYNTTNTNSAAASLLLDLQVGAVSKFKVDKTGLVTIVDTSSLAQIAMADRGTVLSIYTTAFGTQPLLVSASGGIAINNDTGSLRFGASQDAILSRKAAANLRFGAADAATALAQTLSVQSVVAGTSSTAGADFTLTGSQNTGAGLAGNLIVSTGFSNTVGTATVTITIATPGVITWTAHGLVTGSPVVFTTTGALPTGITAGTTYFAITSSTLGVNTFQIATSAVNAAAGTAITTSGTQSGVQTATTSATVQSPLMTTTTFGPSGLTGSQTTPVLNLAQTWNTSGNATGLKLNVTNTASGASSYLMDLQVGGTSKFSVDKTGVVSATSVTVGNSLIQSGYMQARTLFATSSGGVNQVALFPSVGGQAGVWVGAAYPIVFANVNDVNAATGDVFLTRKGAANLQLGAADAASPVAQTLSVQSIVGGVSTNASAAAYPFTINGAQGTGTGAGGSIVFQVAPAAGSSSMAQNTLAAGLTIDSTKLATFAGVVNIGGTSQLGATNGTLYLTELSTGLSGSSSYIKSTATSGVFTIGTSNTDSLIISGGVSPIIKFGGTTTSFPALKRSTTFLQARLADDSAFTNIQGKLTTDTAYTAGALVATGYITIYDSTGTAYRVPCLV